MDGESIRRRCDEYIEEGAENPEYAIMLTRLISYKNTSVNKMRLDTGWRGTLVFLA